MGYNRPSFAFVFIFRYAPGGFMRRLIGLFLFCGLWSIAYCGEIAGPIEAGSYTAVSPDQNIRVTVNTGSELSYAVSVGTRQILRPSPISLALSTGRILGRPAAATGSSTQNIRRILRPVVKVKRAEIRDFFNELRVDFKGGFSLTVRVFDDGIAYRFSTALPGEITVADEQATFRFAEDGLVYFPEEESLLSHQERLYVKTRISEIKAPRFSSLPAIVKLADGFNVGIAESDLLDYPGMDLTVDREPSSLRGLFPGYPAKVRLKNDRDEEVTERASYIAKTRGSRDFPWRVLAIVPEDGRLIETDIIYRLASETSLTDTGWIKPGKVAWDWWNANNIYNVPFRAGINTDTYKYYIDFAAAHGIEYVILDEGWYKLGDLMSVVPEMDMEALTAYAREKGVGLILWVIWKTLDMQMGTALERFEKWGIKGIKVDFMQREDQWMVNFYERVAREASKHQLLVDFHGAYKPTGLSRTYPNVLTSEGVRGLEHNKWSVDASPANVVTFPFIRMLAGPVDYTPGAMINAAKDSFAPIFNRPMSQGTRCQQLALYTVLESPLQMLADSPTNYLREPESLEFLAAVPTVWDETRILEAGLGEYILLARRHGEAWYVGALTNWTPRDLEVSLSFLGDGPYQADIYRDGPNADRVGVDYRREKRSVTSTERLRIHLAPGGGWTARIVRK
jgi:alpha-glucosidase